MLYETILANIKEAMKDKNTALKDVLKQVQSKAQATAKETKSEVTDEIVVNAVNKELKQLNQTLDAIKDKTDSGLYKETVKKIEYLKVYLPKQMSEDEIREVIQKIIDNNPDTEVKKLVGLVMKSLKSKADSKIIKNIFDSFTKQ